jgi:hypothetical protein
MKNIKIGTCDGYTMAFVSPSDTETIYLFFREDMVSEIDESITVLYSSLGCVRTESIFDLLFAILEHESLHCVLDKVVNAKSSSSLDHKINGISFEYERVEDYRGTRLLM